MSVTVFDLDDLCDAMDPWDELHALKAEFPNLKVTLFAVPGRCSEGLLAKYRALPWVEVAVHGYHHSSVECLTWSYSEASAKLAELEEAGWVRLFKAPGWWANEQVYEALFDRGWSVADNIAMYEAWGECRPPRYVYNVPGEHRAIHGHTWETSGNGPRHWPAMFTDVPREAEFAFVSEVCGETPPMTYLWQVIDQMDLKPGDLFVDVGAFTGEEIEVLQPRGVEVLSFEPHPDRAAALAQRWGGVEGVTIVDKAAGASNKRCRLYESEKFASGSTTEQGKRFLTDSYADVEMVRLADYLRDRDVKVLKLDVEGTEWEILDDLLDEGILEKCGQVYVEDHVGRVKGHPIKELRDRVRFKCAEKGIVLREWV